MTLLVNQLAIELPQDALTIVNTDAILSFQKLTNSPSTLQSSASVVPAIAALLEGFTAMVKQTNIKRASASPPVPPLTVISKSIQQSQADTGDDPTMITITYTFTFDTSTRGIITSAIDPS